MSWPVGKREERFHKEDSATKHPFERDRDRVLLSSAFKRLAGITQLAKAGEESIFHTRQQHTIKVAQIGRRLAESMCRRYAELADCINPEVVSAACLIHDLGHPPFGHVGEQALNDLMSPHPDDNRSASLDENKLRDGFEGNAQSFRIVTKLAVLKAGFPGLNLSRAALAAVLKYPWARGEPGEKSYKKWSCYESEKAEFHFAMEFQTENIRTIEADLMDWADDIAYSVHDIADFHQCAALPWSEIFGTDKEKIIAHVTKRKSKSADPFDVPEQRDYVTAFGALENMVTGALYERYEGTLEQRIALRNFTASLTRQYSTDLIDFVDNGAGPRLRVPQALIDQVDILKQIIIDYVRMSPPIQAQRYGYRKIVEGLFSIFLEESQKGRPYFTPTRLRYLWDIDSDERSPARFAADCVSSLSELEATRLFARLNGSESGSLLDPIVR